VFDLLACPVCGEGLGRVAGSLRCGKGHSYDVARQGYVNLLPGGAPASGDTAAMVAARESFLAAGHLDPLVRAVVDAAGSGPGAVLDVGAGPGRYLAAVLEADPARTGLAVDVSKFAARRAARAHPRASAVVADVWRGLPVRDGAADLMLDVFAPRNGPEMARVLAPGATLVTVTPSEAHLAELVGPLGLLGVDERKDERTAASLEPYLERVDANELTWRMTLDRPSVRSVVAMGPSAHHTEPDELERRLAGLPDPVDVTAGVTVTRHRRS
jgi:23S rRNA (guanine745-N1)-methyltransferase